MLARWDVGAERQVIDGCHGTRFTQLRALEPYYYANPWSAALAGKHVLVVHPFADTIRAQYQKRGELFTNAPGGVNTLPELASLTVIPAVPGIGAGAYGLPLAAHARDTGHVAIQMSGATQLLFGIKGRRWDTHPQISKLYNPAWVRPAPAEQPANKQAVEGGSYW